MKAPLTSSSVLFLALFLAAACASDLREENDGGPDVGLDAGVEPTVATSPLSGDDFETRINSSDFDVWIHLSFEAGATDALEVADGSLDWDVAFKRFQIKLNGGISGAGAGELAVADGASLADITTPPADGYVTDVADDPDDEDDDDELAFETAQGGWYDYDPKAHVLSPKPRTYVVRGANAATTIAVQIQSYYNDAGSSGRFTIHWKAL